VSIGQAIAATGLNFANLKYSRSHESEADHIGLIFAAMAGYNPQSALTFWQRMSSLNQNQNTSEFLSDHPSDATRIQQIQGWMPEAMKYYKPKTVQTTTTKATTKTATKTTTKTKTTQPVKKTVKK
jgi:predicted Zn-dependent protease